MTTTTFGRVGTYRSERAGKTFWQRFFDRYTAARMEKAHQRVNAYLQGLSDHDLNRLGYGPADIRRIRTSPSAVSTML